LEDVPPLDPHSAIPPFGHRTYQGLSMPSFGILTENFPPLVGGGIAEWTRGVACALASRGHDVTVYSKWKRRFDPAVHSGRPFRFIPMRGHDWRRWRFAYALVHGFGFLSKHPDGILIATTWELGEPFPWIRRIFPSAKLWVIAHGRDVTKVRRTARLRRTLSAAALIVAVSRFTRSEILVRVGASFGDRVVFVPNGVDGCRFSPGPKPGGFMKTLGIPERAKVILTLARVVERKAHDVVIRALPGVIATFPDAHYVIAGAEEPKWAGKLRDLVRGGGLDAFVHLTGFVPDAELVDWHRMADVYVMPSRGGGEDSEGFGITFLEAGACGVPVIGTDSGGIPDAVIHNETGLLVPSGDSDALAAAIKRILGDPDLAMRLGQAARSRILRELTWDGVTERILQAGGLDLR
jgi:phosphatidylinositol alpha-1,6-mannosyltransferase